MAFFDISRKLQVILIAASLAGCYASGDRQEDDAETDLSDPVDAPFDAVDRVEPDPTIEDVFDVELGTWQALCDEIPDGEVTSDILDHTNEWAIVRLTYNLGRDYRSTESALRVDIPYGGGTVEEITADGIVASFKFFPHLPVRYEESTLVEVAWRLECVGPGGMTSTEYYKGVCLVYEPDEAGDIVYRISHDPWDCETTVCICHAPVVPFSMNDDEHYATPFALFIHASEIDNPRTIELRPEVREASGNVRYEWRVTAGTLEPLSGGRVVWNVPAGSKLAIAQLTATTDYGFCIQTYRYEE